VRELLLRRQGRGAVAAESCILGIAKIAFRAFHNTLNPKNVASYISIHEKIVKSYGIWKPSTNCKYNKDSGRRAQDEQPAGRLAWEEGRSPAS
jgi:hypothetical protein